MKPGKKVKEKLILQKEQFPSTFIVERFIMCFYWRTCEVQNLSRTYLNFPISTHLDFVFVHVFFKSLVFEVDKWCQLNTISVLIGHIFFNRLSISFNSRCQTTLGFKLNNSYVFCMLLNLISTLCCLLAQFSPSRYHAMKIYRLIKCFSAFDFSFLSIVLKKKIIDCENWLRLFSFCLWNIFSKFAPHWNFPQIMDIFGRDFIINTANFHSAVLSQLN